MPDPEKVSNPQLTLLTSPDWEDYELLDSGKGAKLERYGAYTFVRPEHQAVWRRTLPEERWKAAHATFQPTGEESGGQWQFHRPVKTPWKMSYKGLSFLAFTASSRHMGVFPEQAAQWDWMVEKLRAYDNRSQAPVRVLNLFGYTGLATLAAARAGAQVVHVDASKKSMLLARENQALCGLSDRPIRWLVDDAFKFVRREVRRGSQYEGIVLDPPKFGRGPQGQVWELFESLPELLQNCRSLLSPKPSFVILTAYAIRASALSAYYALQDMTKGLSGVIETGELALIERSAGRYLSTAIYARWNSIER
ncbi:MAG: SAM-dependent methyltransferase [Chloroflexi bacterium RBG_16_57_11]|nr:MAG: SAM-dependent methyltransferase [Chloroflexi bacterium RBG_16_57_11]